MLQFCYGQFFSCISPRSDAAVKSAQGAAVKSAQGAAVKQLVNDLQCNFKN